MHTGERLVPRHSVQVQEKWSWHLSYQAQKRWVQARQVYQLGTYFLLETLSFSTTTFSGLTVFCFSTKAAGVVSIKLGCSRGCLYLQLWAYVPRSEGSNLQVVSPGERFQSLEQEPSPLTTLYSFTVPSPPSASSPSPSNCTYIFIYLNLALFSHVLP